MPYDDVTISDVFGEQPHQPLINSGPPREAPSLAENLTYLRSQQEAPSVEDVAQLRAEQDRVLMQHAEYAQGLTERQDQVNLRQGDLDLAQRMMPVFDTQLNKLARMQLWRETARYLGIDPRSETVKDMGRTIVGLDPETSSRVRAAFSQRLTSAQPGQGIDFARGIFGGQVGMYDLMQLVQQTPAPEMQFDPEGDADFWQNTADPNAPMARAGGPRNDQQNNATTQPGEMIPELAERLGYGPQPRTNREAQEQFGYTGPTDPAAQRTLLQERNVAEERRLKLIDKLITIDALGYGRPEVSPNQPWRFPFGMGEATVPTGAQIARGAANALGDTVGDVVAETIPGAPSQLLEGATAAGRRMREGAEVGHLDAQTLTGRQRFIATQGAKQLVEEMAPPSDAPPAERQRWYRERAAITDQIQSLYGGMRFELGAALVGARPAGLSETEGDDLMRQVTTSDPASRRTILARVTREIGNDPDFAGGPAFNVRNVSAERLNAYTTSPLTENTSLRQLAQAELDRRSGQQPPARQTQQPADVPGITVAPAQTQEQAPAQQPTEAERLRQRDADRRTTQEQFEAETRQWARENQGRIERREERDIQAFNEGTPYQRWLQAKSDAEKAQARMQAAFAAAARALGSVSSGGGSSGSSNLGGGQDDSSAFRITPRPQRSAPSPAPAQSGYGNVRRRRGAGGV